MRTHLLAIVVLSVTVVPVGAQEHPPNADRTVIWSILQLAPSYSWTSFPAGTHFAFEWETTPLLYSFGLADIASRTRSFIVEPPARFTGSVELVVSGQIYTTRPGTSRFGASAQVLGHIPLVERGEYLGLTLGFARYALPVGYESYIVGGASTLFGFLQTTLKYAPSTRRWMTSIEFRMF